MNVPIGVWTMTHTLLFCFGALVFGFIADQEAQDRVRTKAIKAGVAERVVNQKTGEVSFKFKECNCE